jgi:predicted aconitase
MKIPQEYVDKQLFIIESYKRMGVKPVLTCTPHYLNRPRRGSHLAWAESSAAIYANSVLGSWTNREGGPSALAAALVGKVPDYGLHRPENRRANVIVNVEADLLSGSDFGALGICVGKLLKDGIPFFEGLSDYTNDDLKQLGTGLASSGMTNIFHYRGEHEKRRGEKMNVEAKDVKDAVDELSTASEDPDLVFIGCPHCSFSEIRNIARAIRGKKVREETKLWICTSRHIKREARNYVNVIEKAGGRVICDTCAVVTWIKNLGIDVLMTNSAKTAYYAPTFNKVGAVLAPLDRCIATACETRSF